MKKTTAIWLAAAAAGLLLLVGLASTPAVWTEARRWYGLVTDREWMRAAVESWGWAAPFVFIGIQIAQVIAAPVPGEATGSIGGYIFGTLSPDSSIPPSVSPSARSSISASAGYWASALCGGSCRRNASSAWTA